MNDEAAVLEKQWPDDATPEQRVALAALYASLESIRDAFDAVTEAGMKPAEALEACGYDVPMFVRPMLNSILAA